MDQKDYIASGVIELYILGALGTEERLEVERMAASNPEVAAELLAAQDAVNNYALRFERNPHPSLRGKILQMTGVNENAKGKVIPMHRSHERTYKYLIAASIAALFISTMASIFFYLKWGEAAVQYALSLNEKNQIAQRFNLVKYENDKMIADFSVMHDPSMNIVTLNSIDSTHHYKARVYWNKFTAQTYIDVQDLPMPATDKQYQLWALVGGKPIDAGIFDMNDASMQRVKPIINAEAWAVTLEPKGGSISPTMNQMYLISKG